MCAVRIVHGKGQRVSKRIVYVRLRCKVQHGVDLLRLENIHQGVGGQDVSFDELKIQIVANRAKIVQGGAIVKLVENDDLVF
jgi:hypothetical protein